MTIKLTNRFRLFLVFATVLVVIPILLALLAYDYLGIEGASAEWITLTIPLFLPLSFYYMPLLLIVGEPYFIGGIGIGPTGWMGVTIAAVFYLAISCILTYIVSPPGDDVSDVLVKRTGLWVGIITSLCASAYCYLFGIRSNLRMWESMNEGLDAPSSAELADLMQAHLIEGTIATGLFAALAILFIFLLRKLHRTQRAR